MKGLLTLILGIGLGLVLARFFFSTASPAAPPPVETTAQQERDDPKKAKEDTDLRKVNEEILKLKQETKGLQSANDSIDSRFKWLTGWLTAAGSIIVALFLYLAGRSLNITQKDKLIQDKEQGRETHLLEVFNDLGDKEPRIRIGAAAILIQRLKRLREKENRQREQHDDIDSAEMHELDMIVGVLISVTKHEEKDQIQKYIADGLADSLDAIFGDAEFKNGKPVKAPSDDGESPLKKYDFQGAKLENAWWKHIDARGVDFYGAHLERIGLRESFLSGAKLRKTNLKGATLEFAQLDKHEKLGEADLQDAQLQRAKLRGANLKGANLKKANLAEADLTEADLSEAELDGADLRGATLTGTTIKGTKFGSADVRGVDLGSTIPDGKTAYAQVKKDSQTIDPPAIAPGP